MSLCVGKHQVFPFKLQASHIRQVVEILIDVNQLKLMPAQTPMLV